MLRRFIENRKGNIAVTFVVGAMPLLLGVGGSLDYFVASNEAARVQSALDAAALAAGQKYFKGLSDVELKALAEKVFRANLDASSLDGVDFFYLSSGSSSGTSSLDEFLAESSGYPSEIVKVEARFVHPAMFGFLDDLPMNRRSVVRISEGMPACVLALDPTAASAIRLQGSTEVRFDGCVLTANSNSDSAITRGGAAQLAAACVSTSGATVGLSSTKADLECGDPLHHQPPTRDPLAGVEPPEYSTCELVPNDKVKTLSPGTYCYENISGDVTLEPGAYVIRGGEISLKGNGSLVGNGITLFLMDGAEMTITANQVVELSAPATGPYAGITIFQDRDNESVLKLRGTAGSSISGVIYAPAAHVTYAGNNSMTGSGACVRVIGRTIEMTGNSEVISDCEGELGDLEIYAGRFVGLIR